MKDTAKGAFARRCAKKILSMEIIECYGPEHVKKVEEIILRELMIVEAEEREAARK